ncbi:MAG: valine--tRNA ligase [Oscillospiraceae bacterium]|nr:valine--tRNA ligase [Oscillospiraceae bacterium]
MNKELPKVYEPHEVEGRVYQAWEDNGCFRGVRDPDKKPFTIVMPPPNVTGQLHIGHAMDDAMQDMLIRYKRMQGYAALYLPGTDHAGIATQIKVEEELREKEGLTRHDLGREKFLERVWDWKHKYGSRIVEQQKKLGVSCDWERSRFTMDEGLSKAVRHVFVSLYDKGLIYKGSRIVNWCPHCVTALSDAEVEYQDKPGRLWHIKYPIAGEPGRYVIVATTRPETMLGDTGVAVNPADERYQDIIGKKCLLPLMDREIPIVADEYVDLEFGTGCVKMTPAHDPNDFEVGLRHSLDTIRVLDDHGVVNENGGKYQGMDRYEARKAVVADLEALGLLEKIEDHQHNVGTCYRCHNDVEPIISAQWFVKMEPLAREALRVVNEGETRFVPERFTKTYTNWMENVHDWCISRQLWWGHQIPVWYCADCGKMTVSEEDPAQCAHCRSQSITRDPDVLDTWFSSASKSLGNGIDPLEMAEKYGADALRFNLITGNAPGNDTRFFVEKCEAMRNFANKIWNASRFVMMNLTIRECVLPGRLEQEDKWILSKLNRVVKEVTENMDAYELGVACAKVYDFIWSDYCDWYIEFTKARLQGEDEGAKEQAQQVLVYVLTGTLKLLHPFMPFLTEEIWQALPREAGCQVRFLMLDAWPVYRQELDFPQEEKSVGLIIDAVRAIRGKRAELNVPPSKKAHVTIATLEQDAFTQGAALLKRLAWASEVSVIGHAGAGSSDEMMQKGLVELQTYAARIFLPLAELVDLDKERARVEKELKKNAAELDKLTAKLGNPGFVGKAPQHVVEAERERAAKLEVLVKKLEAQLAAM